MRRCGRKRSSRRGAPRTLQAASPDAELAALAEWAQERSARRSRRFRAWVSVRDLAARREEVVDALDAALAPQRFSLDVSAWGGALCRGRRHAARATTRRCAPRSNLLAAAAGCRAFRALQRAAARAGAAGLARRGERSGATRCAAAEPSAERGDASRVADAVGGCRSRAARSTAPAALARLRSALRVLDGLAGHHPMSRWLSVWIEAFEQGPWSSAAALVERRVSIGRALSRVAGDSGARRSNFRSISRAAPPRAFCERAARDTPFQDADRRTAHLGEQPVESIPGSLMMGSG